MWWLACGSMAAVGSYVLTAGRGDGAGGTREVVARLKGIPALRSWGVIDKDRWAKYFQWLNDNQLVTNQLDVNAGYDTSYLA